MVSWMEDSSSREEIREASEATDRPAAVEEPRKRRDSEQEAECHWETLDRTDLLLLPLTPPTLRGALP